jgi:predicted transcriptional regulator
MIVKETVLLSYFKAEMEKKDKEIQCLKNELKCQKYELLDEIKYGTGA